MLQNFKPLIPRAGKEIPVSYRTSVIITSILRKIFCMYTTFYT